MKNSIPPNKEKIEIMLSATDIRDIVVTALKDMKATDISVINVKKLTTITDFMIVCSGTSSRHVKSVAEHVIHVVKSEGIKPIGCEGEKDGEWILVDLGEVIIHIMLPRVREFYHLEKLWHRVKTK